MQGHVTCNQQWTISESKELGRCIFSRWCSFWEPFCDAGCSSSLTFTLMFITRIIEFTIYRSRTLWLTYSHVHLLCHWPLRLANYSRISILSRDRQRYLLSPIHKNIERAAKTDLLMHMLFHLFTNYHSCTCSQATTNNTQSHVPTHT